MKMAELLKAVSACLGQDCVEYCEDLALLLLCVSQSVKPGFMWDYPSVSFKKLENMLHVLNAKGLITEHVVTVAVDSDIFILNLDAVTRNLIGYLTSTHSWLIDINTAQPKVASPDIHNQYKNFIHSLLQQLGITKSDTENTISSSGQ